LTLLDPKGGGDGGRESFGDERPAPAFGRSSPAERRPAPAGGGGGHDLDDDIPF
jgi:single-strand DNA-binding protein